MSHQISPILKFGYIYITSIFYFSYANNSFLSKPVLNKIAKTIDLRSYSSTFSLIFLTINASAPTSLSLSLAIKASLSL